MLESSGSIYFGSFLQEVMLIIPWTCTRKTNFMKIPCQWYNRSTSLSVYFLLVIEKLSSNKTFVVSDLWTCRWEDQLDLVWEGLIHLIVLTSSNMYLPWVVAIFPSHQGTIRISYTSRDQTCFHPPILPFIRRSVNLVMVIMLKWLNRGRTNSWWNEEIYILSIYS